MSSLACLAWCLSSSIIDSSKHFRFLFSDSDVFASFYLARYSSYLCLAWVALCNISLVIGTLRTPPTDLT